MEEPELLGGWGSVDRGPVVYILLSIAESLSITIVYVFT